MNSIDAALQTHYESDATTLARCLRLERLDGTILGFTSLDHDLTFGGVVYAGLRGFTGSDVVGGLSLEVDNSEVSGMLNSDNITEADLYAGLWDFAAFRLFEVNYRDLTQLSRKIRAGTLGQCVTNRTGFVAEIVGILQKYQTLIIESSSVSCRAALGDTRCGVDLNAGSPNYTVVGAVSSISGRYVIFDTARTEAAGYFAYGVIRFTSGANMNIGREIKYFNRGSPIDGAIELQLPFPYTVAPGDTYSMCAGCDKAKATCIAKFNNVANMRAEPDLQGRDRLVQVGRS